MSEDRDDCREFQLCGCDNADDLHCMYCCRGVETHDVRLVVPELVREARRWPTEEKAEEVITKWRADMRKHGTDGLAVEVV